MKVKIFLSFFIIAGLMILGGCGCKEASPHQYDLTLEVWGPVDDSSTFAGIFETYKKTNPNIQEIKYKKIPIDSYKREIVEALAAGQGPDVVMIHNTWLPSFNDKLVPSPADIVTEQRYRTDFVDVCARDFLVDGQVWAVPLSVDSLGLYYNKDLFNEVGIVSPPRDWNEFVEDVKKLTIEKNGEILRSGAALGTAYNINRSTDVLNLFIFQSNPEILSSNTINFNSSSAENALNFYNQFSRTGSPSYSWNSRMHYSIDAFTEGNLAMMFNYSWHIPTIESKSPKLNFAVAPIPQFSGTPPVNYANYWAFATTKTAPAKGNVTNNTRVKESWKLINFLTLSPTQAVNAVNTSGGINQGVSSSYDAAKAYISSTGKPAARRDIISTQMSDPKIGIFASGNLIAQSWYQSNSEAIEGLLLEMIDQINRGQVTIHEAMSTVQAKISNL